MSGKKSLKWQARLFFGRFLVKMSNIFLYLAGKAIGYSYIRDLGVVVRHNETVILTREEAESSTDLVKSVEKGELEIIKAVPKNQVPIKDLENLYAGSPLEIDNKVITGKNPSRFLSPAKPRLPSAPKGGQDNRQVGRLQMPPEQPKITQNPGVSAPTQAGLGEDDKNRLDSLQKVLEGLPAALVESVGKMVAESVKQSIQDNISVTVNSVGGASNTSVKDNTPIAVILDDLAPVSVESNIKSTSNSTEESSGGVKDKLKKLRETKGN
jgi:hypothetical protein